MEDTLKEAKGYLEIAKYGEIPAVASHSAQCAIAAALIALCERMDKATGISNQHEAGGSLNVYMVGE